MQYEDLAKYGYKKHHEALFKGYVTRKVTANVYPYSGRFGQGFRAERNNPRSNNYSIVEYWVK